MSDTPSSPPPPDPADRVADEALPGERIVSSDGFVPGDGTEAMRPEPEDPPWERLSPLSLILRGGVVVVAVGGWFAAQLFRRVMDSFNTWDSTSPPEVDDGEQVGFSQILAHPLIATGVLILVVALVAFGAWMNWRFTRYRISRGHVELRKGWLFREQRQVPMERIQAVEIGRPLLAQLLGLAQVVVQSAGGKDSSVTLAFLPLAKAHEVRDRIQREAARSQGSRPGAGSPAGRVGSTPAGSASIGTAPTPSASAAEDALAAPSGGVASSAGRDFLGLSADAGREVLSVPNPRLMMAAVLHSSVFWLVLGGGAWLIGGYVISGWLDSPAGFLTTLPALIPAAIGLLAGRVKEVLKNGNFRLTDHGQAVRTLHGLTDHRTTTVPLHRIQAIEIIQPLWWRPLHWWRARVNVAGSHGDDTELVGETVVLPVGTLEQALDVLTLLDPELDPAALRTAALGGGGEPGWVGTPRSARWLDPLSWRRKGYVVSGHGTLIRSGRLTRRVVSVPHARIQSLMAYQGVIQRWLGLASVRLVSTPGHISPQIQHLTREDAERFLREESTRAQAARGENGRGSAPPGEVKSEVKPEAMAGEGGRGSADMACETPDLSGGLSSVSTPVDRT